MGSASILTLKNYAAVIRALNLLAGRAADGGIGRIYFVACENTLSAPAIFREASILPLLTAEALENISWVHALVDRMCVGLERRRAGGIGARGGLWLGQAGADRR